MPAIEVQDIAKKYRINHGVFGKRPIGQRIGNVMRTAMRNLRQGAALGNVEDFWALKNINFTVNDGEVVGIIGRNGAGKSTLLKILTRITQPTTGRAVIRGRVGSLLEVGTGFHSELTGRENVFLNASILGMKRWETKARFDQIVDFSGVEKFLDTPVKRYSSGMKVRLAFAVAAHLDLEIMLVDEVLSVGDAEFQNKCMGKIDDVAQTGRTIIFVSHNMMSVEHLCARTILLNGGRVVADGETKEVVGRYFDLFSTLENGRQLLDNADERPGTGDARIASVELRSLSGSPLNRVAMGEGFSVRINVLARNPIARAFIAIGIDSVEGARLSTLVSYDTHGMAFELPTDRLVCIECRLPSVNIAPGRWVRSCSLHRAAGREMLDSVERPVSFDVTSTDVYGTGQALRGENLVFFHPEWNVLDQISEAQTSTDGRRAIVG